MPMGIPKSPDVFRVVGSFSLYRALCLIGVDALNWTV